MEDTIEIDASPEQIWPWVADVARMREWHPKLVAAEPLSSGQPRVGFAWRTTWRMGSRQRTFETRIVTCDPPHVVEFVHRDVRPPFREGREHWTLTAIDGGRGTGTRVRQAIDLSASGIAWPWRVLIALIARVGEPAGPTVLERLRERVRGGD